MTGAAYAKALFDLAGDRESDRAAAISEYLTNNPDYQELLDCGALSAKETDELITQAFGESLTSAVLKLMARKRQVYLWSEFATEMERLTDLHNGILQALVKTAVPLSPSLEEGLIGALEQRTGKKIKLNITVEPELLGGISVLADGIYWDGTLREQLQQLQAALKGETP